MWTPANIEREARARDAFTFAGVRYEPEDPFPHRALAIPALELYGLWRAQLIRFEDHPVAVVAAEIPAEVAPPGTKPKYRAPRSAR